MTRNPLYNALAAALYIVTISFVMFFGTQNLPKEDTIAAPIAMISLFTFSAAVMGYVFLSQPLQLFLSDKKKEGIDLFVRTLAIFGVITATVLAQLFLRVF